MPCENTISMKEIGEAFRLRYITRLGFGSFLQFIFFKRNIVFVIYSFIFIHKLFIYSLNSTGQSIAK